MVRWRRSEGSLGLSCAIRKRISWWFQKLFFCKNLATPLKTVLPYLSPFPHCLRYRQQLGGDTGKFHAKRLLIYWPIISYCSQNRTLLVIFLSAWLLLLPISQIMIPKDHRILSSKGWSAETKTWIDGLPGDTGTAPGACSTLRLYGSPMYVYPVVKMCRRSNKYLPSVRPGRGRWIRILAETAPGCEGGACLTAHPGLGHIFGVVRTRPFRQIRIPVER